MVSQLTRQRLRTTNPDPLLSYAQEGEGSSMTACTWKQTKGADGEGHRQLEVQLIDYSSGTDGKPRVPECDGTPLPAPRLGQQACVGLRQNGNITTVTLQVLQGRRFVLVGYNGWDVGFLINEPADPQAFAKAVAEVGREVLAAR